MIIISLLFSRSLYTEREQDGKAIHKSFFTDCSIVHRLLSPTSPVEPTPHPQTIQDGTSIIPPFFFFFFFIFLLWHPKLNRVTLSFLLLYKTQQTEKEKKDPREINEFNRTRFVCVCLFELLSRPGVRMSSNSICPIKTAKSKIKSKKKRDNKAYDIKQQGGYGNSKDSKPSQVSIKKRPSDSL